MKNAGRALAGKEALEAQELEADKGALARLRGLFTSCGKTFAHMLKDAPVVILDEATANVDPENEAELQAAIEALTGGKTIIMIAHRLKKVRHANQILVVDHGKIVQHGTHEELIKQGGIYGDFVHSRKSAESWRITDPRKGEANGK